MSALTAATLIEHLRRARVNVRARTAHAAAARIEGLEMTLAAVARNCPDPATRALAQSALDRPIDPSPQP